jgi:hypothetical protein
MRTRRSNVSVQVVAYVALVAIAFVLSILIMGLYLRVCRTKRAPVRISSRESLPPGDNSASCPTAVSAAAEALGCRERHPHQGATEESTVPTETTRLAPLSESSMREEV